MLESLVGVTQEDDGKWDGEPGYNAKLDDGRRITIRWDLVMKIG